MNPFKVIAKAFVKFGKLCGQALTAAAKHGLTDDVLTLALGFVKQAGREQLDSAGRREWAVTKLQQAKVPESISRLAVEMALQLAREQLEKLKG